MSKPDRLVAQFGPLFIPAGATHLLSAVILPLSAIYDEHITCVDDMEPWRRTFWVRARDTSAITGTGVGGTADGTPAPAPGYAVGSSSGSAAPDDEVQEAFC